MKYIISLDQGTTSSRAILINDQGALVGIEQMEFEQIFPKPGWVEHSPMEILNSQIKVFEDLIVNNNISLDSIISLGLSLIHI